MHKFYYLKNKIKIDFLLRNNLIDIFIYDLNIINKNLGHKKKMRM